MKNKKKILFAVLNWGLGHATRSWELINNLLNEGNEVILASDGVAKEFLMKEFPQLKMFEVPSYNIQYGEKGNILPLIKNGLNTQIAVKREQVWLKRFLKKQKVDLIISDNRYGMYCSEIKSIIITHQLNIKVPILENVVNAQNHFWLNRFHEIWVPDHENTLSGELSQPIPSKLMNKVKEIGWISRFKKSDTASEELILAIVSGPEPQKTILIEKLVPILKNLDHKVILYTGNPNENKEEIHGLLTIKSHDSTPEFIKNIQKAKVIIGRPGYSSIMDYWVLQKKMILIPTPGQFEQLYLAKHLFVNHNVTYTQQSLLSFATLRRLLRENRIEI